MSSKAQKRRAARERARISLAGGVSVEQRPTGKDRRHTNQAEDARKPAVEARQRHTGVTDPKEALEALLATDLGRCVHALTKGEERTKLAGVWAALSASRANYKARFLGVTGNPKCATFEMVPDRTESDQSLRVDMRTPDEKDNAAKASWAGWAAKIKALPTPLHIWAINGALDGFMGEATLWKDCAPTDKGRAAVDALRKVGEA